MEQNKKSFYDVFKERWNRENMSRAFLLPSSKLFAAILVGAVVILFLIEATLFLRWFIGEHSSVTFSFCDLAFYEEVYIAEENHILINIHSFNVSLIVMTLPFFLLSLFSLRRISNKTLSEEEVQNAVNRTIVRNRLATAAGFFIIGPAVVCKTLVSRHWCGVYTSFIYGHTELVKNEILSRWYFILILIAATAFAILSAAVYSLMTKILRDNVKKGRDSVLKGLEISAKISFALLLLLIFFAFFAVLNGNDICCFTKWPVKNSPIPDLVYPLIVGVLAVLLNRYRSVLAKNCVAIADEREKVDA